jgi:hypothetical protein
MPSTDSGRPAKSGYKQELGRSLGALLPVRRRVQLHLDHDRGVRAVLLRLRVRGPAWIWIWPAVLAGQMPAALCFAEPAVHAGRIRMTFTMGRDNRLPAASAIARVHGKWPTRAR